MVKDHWTTASFIREVEGRTSTTVAIPEALAERSTQESECRRLGPVGVCGAIMLCYVLCYRIPVLACIFNVFALNSASLCMDGKRSKNALIGDASFAKRAKRTCTGVPQKFEARWRAKCEIDWHYG